MNEILQRFKREYQRLNGKVGVMDLEVILNEAKKEFPLYYYDIPTLKKDLQKPTVSINNSGAKKIIDWFERWFGTK